MQLHQVLQPDAKPLRSALAINWPAQRPFVKPIPVADLRRRGQSSRNSVRDECLLPLASSQTMLTA